MMMMPLVPLESRLPRVLVMDDCVEIQDLLNDVLREDGVCLIQRRELLSLDEIKSLAPALIILERRFRDSIAGSWMLIHEIRRDPVLSETPIILCTTDPTPRFSLSMQWELQSLGVHVLLKPFHLEDLRGLVRGAHAGELVAGQSGQDA